MLFNKKGSLEISIQAIVIVVLAMTLLGLGLGFIRGMFRDIGSISQDVSEQVKNKILDDLIQGDKKISFPKTTIEIDKGGAETLTVGIRNKKDTPMQYSLEFESINFIATSGAETEPFSITNPPWFQTGEPIDGYRLSASESDVRNARLRVPKSAREGSYVLTFKVVDLDFPADIDPDTPGNQPDPDRVYAQKDFFIVVRG